MKINAYNITGKEFAFHANVNMQAGTYEVRFDVRQCGPSTELSSGIYFCRMGINGEIAKTRKLVLNK